MAARERSERSRKERRRSERPTFLIVCEGRTEEGYFCDIKRRLRAQWMVISHSHKNDPMGLVESAIKSSRDLERKGLDVIPWVVFDAESAQEQGARGYADAIAMASRKHIKVANSSPCFEYWILLHFNDGILVADPSEAARRLSANGYIPGYRKPDLPYATLWETFLSGKPSQAAAARRKSLEEDGEDPRLGRPVTYVDFLVDALSGVAGA